jgi:hypothetical protein
MSRIFMQTFVLSNWRFRRGALQSMPVGDRSRPAANPLLQSGDDSMQFPRFPFSSKLLRGGVATAPGSVISSDSQRVASRIGESASDSSPQSTQEGRDPELDRIMKEREAELERFLARQKPELIQQGIEAYKRDLPLLLAEKRYLNHVAYRGNEMVAIAPTNRKLWKKLEKLGLTDRGEIFETVVEPLDIDEDDEIQGEGASSGIYLKQVKCDPELDRIMQERAAEVERIAARRKPELIQQGIDAYQRDLPRLLAEKRYLQHVAYRGNEMVAIAVTERKLEKKLEKLGLTDMGELYTTVVAPLQIDEDDEVQSECPSVGLSQP